MLCAEFEKGVVLGWHVDKCAELGLGLVQLGEEVMALL